MPTKRCSGAALFSLTLALILTALSATDAQGGLILTLEAEPVLSITDDVGPFTLQFSDFVEGSSSDVQTVAYRIQANNMASGVVSGAVTAHLSESFQGVDLTADVTGYSNLGHPNFATLSENQAGSIAIQIAPTSLADKQSGNGQGDSCLDGQLTVNWQARLTQDAAAGSTTRTLIVTLKDGR